MSEQTWSEVDAYVSAHVIPDDPALAAAVAANDAAGIARGAISPAEGRLLELLARLHGARSILEIGTLGAYSTIWLARALAPGGRLVTLELDPRSAEVARQNVEVAGFGEIVQVRVGAALDTLAELVDEGAGPFDLIFIDADKQNNPGYLEWSLKLTRPGSAIVADNVVRAGAILEPGADDPRLGDGGIQGLRRFYELIAAEPRLTATAIQTVGVKGHDGFVLALVTDGSS
jgi:predicted O-methyltransferase YrrM